MKFTLAAVVGLMLNSSAKAFSLGGNGKNIRTKEQIGKDSLTSDRRSFISTALVAGSTGLLSLSQSANAAYFDADGNKVDRFGRPIPLYESLKAKSNSVAKSNTVATSKAGSKDPTLLAEANEQKAKEEQARLIEEQNRLAEEQQRIEEEKLKLERIPPEAPRVLVLGGTGTVGKEVRSKLEGQGFFVVATSRDGRENTVQLDVTKCFGKIEQEITQLARENRCSAVVSLIGGVGTDNDGLLNGTTGQAALAASSVPCVRNFVAIGPSTSIATKVPKGLEAYVKAKQLSQEIVVSTFKPDPKKEGMSYTIINPGAIGKAKNYGSDPSVPLETIANAVVVGATGFYLGESSSVLENVEEIKKKASQISKVNKLKA